jgi:hypothetical protein
MLLEGTNMVMNEIFGLCLTVLMDFIHMCIMWKQINKLHNYDLFLIPAVFALRIKEFKGK